MMTMMMRGMRSTRMIWTRCVELLSVYCGWAGARTELDQPLMNLSLLDHSLWFLYWSRAQISDSLTFLFIPFNPQLDHTPT
jgi:hypothetical protein